MFQYPEGGESPTATTMLLQLQQACYGGFEVVATTFLLTVLLELTSIGTVKELLLHQDTTAEDGGGDGTTRTDDDGAYDDERGRRQQQRKQRNLYKAAVVANLVNHFVLGIPVYAVAVTFFCRRDDADDGGDAFRTLLSSAVRVAWIVLTHAVAYYSVHRAMHTVPGMYRYHKFHHQFNNPRCIPVMAANAVSVVEYLLAYAFPFALAAMLFHPTEREIKIAVYVVSVSNLLIHTPALERAAAAGTATTSTTSRRFFFGPWFVTASSHGQHHRQLAVNYAAPIVNIDWFLSRFSDLFLQRPNDGDSKERDNNDNDKKQL